MSVQDGGEMGHLKVGREDTGIGVRLLEWGETWARGRRN